MLSAYEAWAPTYDDDSIRSFGYAAPPAAAAALATHLTDSRARILDVGVGTGQVGTSLVARGYGLVDGIDVSAAMLEQAALKRCYQRLIRADASDAAAVPLHAYDAIVSVGTLLLPNHIGDTHGSVLRLWLDWVRPGGLVCLSTRTDLWSEAARADVIGSVPAVAAALEDEQRWRLLETTEPAPYTPGVAGELTFQVRVYRAAAD